ncbi:MAG: hypothetical protein ACXAB7_13695 [Candidatus Kariarchaeaceae archaeon]|jgi:hypothetical protein
MSVTRSYSNTQYDSTHNSFSHKQSIFDQLDDGVRGIEFDVHDHYIRYFKDFRIGHSYPGYEVSHGLKSVRDDPKTNNPDSDKLTDWLELVNRWSQYNNDHEPITIFLDIKDDFHNNPEGLGFDLLNNQLTNIFGTRLYTYLDYKKEQTWPALNDRIIVVLTGNSTGRREYITNFNDCCFVSYSYQGGKGDAGVFGSDLLEHTPFINVKFSKRPNDINFVKNMKKNGKLIRLWNVGSDPEKRISKYLSFNDYNFAARDPNNYIGVFLWHFFVATPRTILRRIYSFIKIKLLRRK